MGKAVPGLFDGSSSIDSSGVEFGAVVGVGVYRSVELGADVGDVLLCGIGWCGV